MESFSSRHGITSPPADIVVRNDAPLELRGVVRVIASKAGLPPKSIRFVVCETLLKSPDDNSWSDPNVEFEVDGLLKSCAWNEVYDTIEALHAHLRRHNVHSRDGQHGATIFEHEVNRYFAASGIGWQLVAGRLIVRGGEVFERALRESAEALRAQRRPTAATELHEAVVDLSRRPHADVTGAIQHAMAALECVARDTNNSKDTLGDLIRRNPGLFPPPIDDIVHKAWGWTSNNGRHLQEHRPPAFEEAELMVGISGVLCRYLSRRVPT